MTVSSDITIAGGDFQAPQEPPPLLNEEQLGHLAVHGWLSLPLPERFLEDLLALSAEVSYFFDKPMDEKKTLYPQKFGTEFGFYHVANEKEYVTLRCQIHPESNLEQKSRRTWQDAAALLHRILCDISRASGLSSTVWDNILDGTLDVPGNPDMMTGTLLRLFRYYPGTGFAGQHTDLGLLTLCIGGQGLQVSESDGVNRVWKDADGPTVLVGQTLRALSDNWIRPGLHRVVENPNGRSSVIFALRHSYNHPIDLSLFGGQGSIDPRKLWDEIKVGIVNINATADVREKQRADIDMKRRNAHNKTQAE